MSPRLMVLDVGPMATEAPRIHGEGSDGESIASQAQTALRPSGGRDAASLVASRDARPWYVPTLIGQAPQPEPWQQPLFESRGVHIEGEND
jgi:hypothetical protein